MKIIKTVEIEINKKHAIMISEKEWDKMEEASSEDMKRWWALTGYPGIVFDDGREWNERPVIEKDYKFYYYGVE